MSLWLFLSGEAQCHEQRPERESVYKSSTSLAELVSLSLSFVFIRGVWDTVTDIMLLWRLSFSLVRMWDHLCRDFPPPSVSVSISLWDCLCVDTTGLWDFLMVLWVVSKEWATICHWATRRLFWIHALCGGLLSRLASLYNGQLAMQNGRIMFIIKENLVMCIQTITVTCFYQWQNDLLMPNGVFCHFYRNVGVSTGPQGLVGCCISEWNSTVVNLYGKGLAYRLSKDNSDVEPWRQRVHSSATVTGLN